MTGLAIALVTHELCAESIFLKRCVKLLNNPTFNNTQTTSDFVSFGRKCLIPKGTTPAPCGKKSIFNVTLPETIVWAGGNELPGGAPHLEEAREAWADELVKACEERGLSVIAITDHHDTTMTPYVLRAAGRSHYNLVVLPGVEITGSDDAQCLAIFDPETGITSTTKLINKLPEVLASHADEPKTCPTQPTTWTVAELFDAMAKDSHLSETGVCLPHFSDGHSHKHINKDRTHTRFANLPSDAIYIEKPFQELAPDTIEKIYGKVVDWGSRRRAIVPTGDNKTHTWDRLGSNDCWIKLGERTIESVRQALLADEARISFTPPEEPLERVVSLKVKSTLTGEEPIVVTFNAGFNALIGGRGSEKRAILEYLRFGLGRTDRDLDQSEKRDREEELIKNTLGDGGFVTVEIEREGVHEIWSRSLSKDQISVTGPFSDEILLTLPEARRRFRGRAFHQKQLSTTTKTAESAIEQITGIAAAEALDRRREIDQAIENVKRTITTTLRQLVAHWQADFERLRALTRLNDLKARIQALNDRLKSEGVLESSLQVISDRARYGRAESYLSYVSRALEQESNRLRTIKHTLISIPDDQFFDVDTFPELKTLREEIDAGRTQAYLLVEQVSRVVDNLQASHVAAAASVETKQSAFAVSLEAALEQQKAHVTLLDEHKRLNDELRHVEQKIAELTASFVQTKTSKDEFNEFRQKLRDLVGERGKVLSDAATMVAGKSSELLKARLKRDSSPVEYCESVERLLYRAAVPDVALRCKNWIEQSLQADAPRAWEDICELVIAIYQYKVGAGMPSEPDDIIEVALRNLFRLEGNITRRQLARAYANFDDETVGKLLASVPQDYIAMTYVDGGRDMAFAKASPANKPRRY